MAMIFIQREIYDKRKLPKKNPLFPFLLPPPEKIGEIKEEKESIMINLIELEQFF